jgi:hypothetical protein
MGSVIRQLLWRRSLATEGSDILRLHGHSVFSGGDVCVTASAANPEGEATGTPGVEEGINTGADIFL